MKIEFEQIGVVHSPFKEKFGVPRQPGLVPQIQATLELLPPYDRAEAVSGLEGYSHVWVQFLFHKAQRDEWQPTVRPPRLGGNRRVGVFASRSPFRPNPIGLSVVKLEGVDCSGGKVVLELSGVDLVDGTPVLDIKPYVPYVDSIPGAVPGFAPTPPASVLKVCFSSTAKGQLERRPDGPKLQEQIMALLETDPRPAYLGRGQQQDRVYGIRLYEFDLRWQVRGDEAEVLEIADV